MTRIEDPGRTPGPARPSDGEYEFVPRIVNPVKIRHGVILAADEEVRAAGSALRESMPWVEMTALSDLGSAARYASDQATVFLFDDTAMTLVRADEIRKNVRDAVVVLLSSNPFIQSSPPWAAREKFPYTAKADLVFATSRDEFPPAKVIPFAVRAAEDRLNIEKYSEVRRFVFLIVDDEPRWFSQFLGVLYGILGQRADVMVARTYEEALAFLFGVEREGDIDAEHFRRRGHGDDVVCLITDVFFPRGREVNAEAGRDLIALARRYYPHYSIVIASKAKEAEEFRREAFLLPKGDPGSLEKLHDYILSHTGMGDLVIRDEADAEVRRARNIRELREVVREAGAETAAAKALRGRLQAYGDNDRFSTWLYMHSFPELGDRLRPLHLQGAEMLRTLERELEQEMERIPRTPLLVDGKPVFGLAELARVLRAVDPAKIQQFSDDDVFSSWLDRKGYPELAEAFRPVHGSGRPLVEELADLVEHWARVYRGRGEEL